MLHYSLKKREKSHYQKSHIYLESLLLHVHLEFSLQILRGAPSHKYLITNRKSDLLNNFVLCSRRVTTQQTADVIFVAVRTSSLK
jgi:hypothetical protein